jgi:ABC-type dipeptide/oligopeptide/nickel transport system permease component
VPGWLAVLSLLVCVPVGIVLVLLTSWPRQKKALVAGLVGAAYPAWWPAT